MFIKKHIQLISRKREEELGVVTYDIRCKLSYILRNCLLCTREIRKASAEYE